MVSTIHMPPSAAFETFDRLILLVDGYIVYQGYADLSPYYFNSIGFNCPEYANPADYFLKRLAVSYPKCRRDQDKIDYLYE